ncbi:MAG TPA: MFS transporter [Solirubrobacteraceae bacterium]|nr:MFS transporter [Solirubrobacteraceae bacterium]
MSESVAPAGGVVVGRERLSRVAVAVTFFCHGLFFAAWAAHIPHVKAALGLSAGELGVVLLAAPLGVVSALALAARLLPRWGSRRAVRGAVLGYCLAGVLVGLAPSAPALFAALFAWGAFQAVLDMAMNTQGIAVERLAHRRLMSGLHGCWSLGAFSGAALGAAAVGAGISLTAQQVMLTIPIVLVVGTLSLWMVDDVPAAPPDESTDGHAANRPGTRRRLILSGTILTLAAIAFAGLLCEGAAADWSAVYLRTGLHTSAGYAGLAYTAFSLAMVAVRLSGNRLTTRFRLDRLLPALAAVATVGITSGLIADSPLAGILGFACLGVGLGSIVPNTFSAAGRVPGAEVGASVSTVAALSYSGFVFGPPLIGALAAVVTLRFALLLLPLLTATITVLTARTRALA